jgi:hypothetical protein
MLGIRRFGGVAIDLFQGELRLFACDAVLDGASIGEGLAAADVAGSRHVAIVGGKDPEAALGAVDRYLRGERPGAVARITFVLSSVPQYYEFQESLFRLFPDEA